MVGRMVGRWKGIGRWWEKGGLVLVFLGWIRIRGTGDVGLIPGLSEKGMGCAVMIPDRETVGGAVETGVYANGEGEEPCKGC